MNAVSQALSPAILQGRVYWSVRDLHNAVLAKGPFSSVAGPQLSALGFEPLAYEVPSVEAIIAFEDEEEKALQADFEAFQAANRRRAALAEEIHNLRAKAWNQQRDLIWYRQAEFPQGAAIEEAALSVTLSNLEDACREWGPVAVVPVQGGGLFPGPVTRFRAPVWGRMGSQQHLRVTSDCPALHSVLDETWRGENLGFLTNRPDGSWGAWII